MNSNIDIRNLEDDDIQYIIFHFKDNFKCSWDIEQFIQETKSDSSLFYIAKIKNIIVGFICVKVILDEMEILNIVINENYRNRKIGTTLLSYIIDFAKNNKYTLMRLEVNVNNIHAIKLYKNLGFNLISIRKEYYLDKKNNTKENAYIMTKNL